MNKHAQYLREIVFLKHDYDAATLKQLTGNDVDTKTCLHRLLAAISNAEKELSL